MRVDASKCLPKALVVPSERSVVQSSIGKQGFLPSDTQLRDHILFLIQAAHWEGAHTLIRHAFPTESSLIRANRSVSCRGDEGGPLPVWLPAGVAGRAEAQWRAVEQCVWEGVDALFAAQFACLSDVYRRPFQDFFEKMGVLPTPPVSW
jgi:hypothetical protein